MDTREFFNNMAETWDETSPHDLTKIGLMLSLLNIKQGDTVLDVGTGTGVLLSPLMKLTPARSIFAIDAAEKMIEKARNKFSGAGINFITADVMEYPFQKQFFDHIICYSVFPHLEQKGALIKRFSDFLKPGGLLSVLHSSSKEIINGVHAHTRSHNINSDYLLPAAEYIPLLNANGLREEIVIDNEQMFMFCARKRWQ